MNLLERKRYTPFEDPFAKRPEGKNGKKTSAEVEATVAKIKAMEEREKMEREGREAEAKMVGWSSRRREGKLIEETSRNIQSGIPHSLESPLKKLGWETRKEYRGQRQGERPVQKPRYKTDEERRRLAA